MKSYALPNVDYKIADGTEAVPWSELSAIIETTSLTNYLG